MLSASNTQVTQRKPLTSSQIIEDIEAITKSEEQRDKLFACLDNKFPVTHRRKYAEMEAFLKGAQKLEEVSKSLQQHVKNLEMLAEGLTTSLNEIEQKIEACQ